MILEILKATVIEGDGPDHVFVVFDCANPLPEEVEKSRYLTMKFLAPAGQGYGYTRDTLQVSSTKITYVKRDGRRV